MLFQCSKDFPLAQTKQGTLRGYVLDGVYTFHGIKYADADRWQMPQPVKSWEGVKNADSFGFVCPIMYDDAPGGELRYHHGYWPGDENCQYLNVWSTDMTAKKPVMVWIHGGGYSFGSCKELAAVDGDSLCRNGDVVVVTLNHRLNIIGFLDLSEYGEEYRYSANLGMADLVAALQWIKKNIAAFGGDPDNVTLFGQSGGGGKIQALMQIPAAEGLFHKAIVQSGYYRVPVLKSHAKVLPAKMMEHLGVKTVAEMAKLPYRDIVAAYNAVAPALRDEGYDVDWHPNPDGDYFLGSGVENGFCEWAKTIPTMSGVTFSEFNYSHLPTDWKSLSDKQVDSLLEKRYGEYAGQLKEQFAVAFPEKEKAELLAFDSYFGYPNKKFLDAKAAASSAPTYSYMFSYTFPYYDGSPAWHCSEIPYAYHSTKDTPICGEPVVRERLETQMCTAWTNFAKYGNPSCAMLPQWDEYTRGNEVTMIFDRSCRVAVDYDRKLLETHFAATGGKR
ncbi:MAG: carboxylesterase/lipase family protein [Oscillospiraceae bacterium]|nr:carboxylesterase/lipase family protein [Oscillospiraceae bacterium]